MLSPLLSFSFPHSSIHCLSTFSAIVHQKNNINHNQKKKKQKTKHKKQIGRRAERVCARHIVRCGAVRCIVLFCFVLLLTRLRVSLSKPPAGMRLPPFSSSFPTITIFFIPFDCLSLDVQSFPVPFAWQARQDKARQGKTRQSTHLLHSFGHRSQCESPMRMFAVVVVVVVVVIVIIVWMLDVVGMATTRRSSDCSSHREGGREGERERERGRRVSIRANAV